MVLDHRPSSDGSRERATVIVTVTQPLYESCIIFGLLTLRHLHLAAQYRRNLLPLRLPIRCRLQEKELQDAKSQGEVGEERLSAQPISAQRFAPLTS